MKKIWVDLPNDEKILIKYSRWFGELHLYYNGIERGVLSGGGQMNFSVEGADVTIDAKVTRFSQWDPRNPEHEKDIISEEIIVSVNGKEVLKLHPWFPLY